MTCRRRFLLSLLLVGLLSTFGVSAEPKISAPQTEMNQVVTRGELVTDLEKILLRCENDSAQYATKNDLQSLRQMLRGLRLELDSLGTRTTVSEDQSGEVQQRVEETRRPGF